MKTRLLIHPEELKKSSTKATLYTIFGLTMLSRNLQVRKMPNAVTGDAKP